MEFCIYIPGDRKLKRESTRSSNNEWTKILYQDNLHHLYCKPPCGCFQYLLNSFLLTPDVKNKFWSSYETLERTGEMKLIMKFCLCLRSLSRGTFLIYFLAFPCEYIYNIFSFHFKQLFISLAFNKYKKDSNILKIILVQGFCSIKTEIARFPIGFRLNM